MTLAVGDPAPRFSLQQGPGDVVDVGSLIGAEKVVLLFFPLAFSGVCTRELCTVRDTWDVWAALDARVFGISVDSAFALRRYRELEGIPFPLLSDFNKTVSADHGVLYDTWFGLHGVAKRSAFVIGRDGRVAWAWVTEDADVEPDYERIRRAVEEAP